MRKIAVLFLLVCCGWYTGCGLSFAATPLRVITTVAPLTDLVHQVGRDTIRLHGLVPAGVNSHTFQPAPTAVKYIAEADLIILNGLNLEVPIEKLARSSGKAGVTLLKLGDQTITEAEWIFDFSFPKEEGDPNPHLWLNVAYAMKYVELIRDQLSTLDATHQEIYQQNARQYLKKLSHLDQAIAQAVSTIPLSQRKLLTYHDSWPYFAKRYGMAVIGAVQPASFAEPSPRDVAMIIEQLRTEKVPAVFGSEVFPSKVLEKIAAEAGVRYISTLRDDALPGSVGTPEHSYIGMMLENVQMMVTALGGDPRSLQHIPLSP
jgi:ABC-type Zn uptake system ZnuABC Zn-binding protein ZnuA